MKASRGVAAVYHGLAYASQRRRAGQPLWLAQKQAVGLAYASVLRQEATMSFVECFWLLGVAMLVIIPTVFVMRRPPRTAGPAPGAH
jgi:hypothetical protein